MKPGNTINKTITVKNTGSLEAKYNIIWQKLINEITNDEMLIEGTCTSSNGTCDSIVSSPISDKNIKKNISIASGVTHTYNLTITFKETNTSQNYNQGKKFNGILGIEEAKDNVCVYDGEVVEGASFTNGIYTYTYENDSGLEGWKVNITNENSTDEIHEVPCIKVNNDYIISMSALFASSNASIIDVSGFDTSHIKNMYGMFAETTAKKIIGLEKLNTSQVSTMSHMFYNSQATTLDLSSFDTSNVTDMWMMFAYLNTNILDLSSFVLNSSVELDYMFSGTSATVGYAKDEATAAKFNDSSVTEIPSTLKFTVKQ